MKFPSLTRLPKNKKFSYEPRYYDPVKEDIKNRTERIQKELEKESYQTFRSQLSEGFSRRQKQDRRMSSMQLVLVALMLATFFGYLYIGIEALFAFMIVFPVYIFIRTRKFFR